MRTRRLLPMEADAASGICIGADGLDPGSGRCKQVVSAFLRGRMPTGVHTSAHRAARFRAFERL
jgi:hypothetical protein